MPVKIKIIGQTNSKEARAAEKLAETFRRELPELVDGDVLIVSSATLFGQAVKDVDILVFGQLDRYSLELKCRTHKEERFELRKVYINNFVICIEEKSVDTRDIELIGTSLCVRYNGKLHDATTQSEKQKISLKNYLEERTGKKAPHVFNFLWMQSLTADSIKKLLGFSQSGVPRHNYLPGSFSLKWLFQLACLQKPPYQPDGKTHVVLNSQPMNGKTTTEDFANIMLLFSASRKAVGELTRKKLETVTSRLLDDQKYAAAIGNKLVVISGRAGTGKTIKLLRIACDLARNHGRRCLILTYNLALVSDIKRTLALIDIPDNLDSYSVSIQSLYKFFYDLMLGFGIATEDFINRNELVSRRHIKDFLPQYKTYLRNLFDYIEHGAIGDKDIQQLMISRHDEVAWDFVLIDEAQDWELEEKRILYRIFGPEKIIIADGVDQLVRSQSRCNWIHSVEFAKTNEKRCLRQKRNLVDFVNAYADCFSLKWALDPLDDLVGGKVIVTTTTLDYELFQREFRHCQENGNKAYEMLYLCPPSYVQKEQDGTQSFAYHREFYNNQIELWDGTRKDLRSTYPTDVNQHRILQYDSCRGLEGWTVVCLALDEFVRYKQDTYKDNESEQELFTEDREERKQRFIHLWSLIPLTRAIDTLVITLKNPQSDFSRRLKACCDAYPDIVEWRNSLP